MRGAALLGALVLLGGCAAGGASQHRGGQLSQQAYLSAIQAIPGPIRNGSTGAPLEGLMVSGTITNDGQAPLRCSPSEFVLVSSNGNDVMPSTEFCAVPTLAPQQSSYFNVTFAAAPRDDLQLRFEHGDGSYEIHDLAVPPG